jgi:hypothetical protein
VEQLAVKNRLAAYGVFDQVGIVHGGLMAGIERELEWQRYLISALRRSRMPLHQEQSRHAGNA